MTKPNYRAATNAVGGRLSDRLSVPVAPAVIGAALLALLLAQAAHALFGVGGAGLDSFFSQLVYRVLVV